jgi:hypothetical protein
MKFSEIFDFNYPSGLILRMFADPDYYRAKYKKMGVEPEILDMRRGEASFSITVRHALDARRLRFPDFVKGRFGDCLHLRQIDTWRLDRGEGRIDLEIEKAPVWAGALLHLRDHSGDCRLTLDFDIRASVPFLGKRIEQGVAGPISRHIRKEMALSQDIAADYL